MKRFRGGLVSKAHRLLYHSTLGLRVIKTWQLAPVKALNVPALAAAGLRGWLWGLGFGFWGLGFGVWGLGFRVQGSGFRVWGLGFRVWGPGLRVWGSGLRVQGLGSGI